ncbi:MAG: MBL fold metallo-hydrolase [Haloarculaceae archaeon]
MEYERIAFDQPLYGTVNVVRVGDTLVDTGHPAPDLRADTVAALDDGPLSGVERVVLTHPHIDHVGGSETLPELTDLPHTVYEGATDVLHDFTAYVPEARAEMTERTRGVLDDDAPTQDAYFPLREYADEAVAVERVVSDGDTVRLGDYDCTVVHTPGHSAQHMALYHEPSGVMLSGDIVSQNGHFMYAPLYCDTDDYVDSLERIRDLSPDVLVPGHGPVIDDPRAYVDDCLEKARAAEAGLRRYLDGRTESFYARDVARDVFGATESTMRFLTLVACEYLESLQREGVVTVDYRDDGALVRPA